MKKEAHLEVLAFDCSQNKMKGATPASGVLQNILVNLQSEKLVFVPPVYTVNTLTYC